MNAKHIDGPNAELTHNAKIYVVCRIDILCVCISTTDRLAHDHCTYIDKALRLEVDDREVPVMNHQIPSPKSPSNSRNAYPEFQRKISACVRSTFSIHLIMLEEQQDV